MSEDVRIKLHTDTEGRGRSRGSAASREGRRKYPNFREKFPSCGSHSTPQIRERKGTRSAHERGRIRIFASHPGRSPFEGVRLPALNLSVERETVFRSFDSAAGIEYTRRPTEIVPFCHADADDCQEIISVRASPFTNHLIIPLRSSVPLMPACRRGAFGKRILADISQIFGCPYTLRDEFAPRERTLRPRENIRRIGRYLVSFPFPFDENVYRLIFARNVEWCFLTPMRGIESARESTSYRGCVLRIYFFSLIVR